MRLVEEFGDFVSMKVFDMHQMAINSFLTCREQAGGATRKVVQSLSLDSYHPRSTLLAIQKGDHLEKVCMCKYVKICVF